EPVIEADRRQPQTIGVKISILVILLSRIELRLRRAIARIKTRLLQGHDIFSSHGNDVCGQLARPVLHQSAKDQLVAATAPEVRLDEGILIHERFNIGADQLRIGNGIMDKNALASGTILESFLPFCWW